MFSSIWKLFYIELTSGLDLREAERGLSGEIGTMTSWVREPVLLMCSGSAI
jgi:hypothetical protein